MRIGKVLPRLNAKFHVQFPDGILAPTKAAEEFLLVRGVLAKCETAALQNLSDLLITKTLKIAQDDGDAKNMGNTV